jgi:hypothetical protein
MGAFQPLDRWTVLGLCVFAYSGLGFCENFGICTDAGDKAI